MPLIADCHFPFHSTVPVFFMKMCSELPENSPALRERRVWFPTSHRLENWPVLFGTRRSKKISRVNHGLMQPALVPPLIQLTPALSCSFTKNDGMRVDCANTWLTYSVVWPGSLHTSHACALGAHWLYCVCRNAARATLNCPSLRKYISQTHYATACRNSQVAIYLFRHNNVTSARDALHYMSIQCKCLRQYSLL